MSRLQNLLHSLSKLKIVPPSPSLTKFTLFSKLPLELRHKIIRLAAHIPREIMLGWYHEFFILPPAIYDWNALTHASSFNVPSPPSSTHPPNFEQKAFGTTNCANATTTITCWRSQNVTSKSRRTFSSRPISREIGSASFLDSIRIHWEGERTSTFTRGISRPKPSTRSRS
tara:strand:+ start:1130 stop:1642 length:513 start_codon:yes stop_codon:yes gene_type:complete